MKIFIAGQPKSGSTHLLGCLMRYFDAEYTMCNQWCSQGVEAQDVNRFLLDQGVQKEGNWVWKQHLLATPNNVGMLQGTRDWFLPIIITTRNVPDTLASYYDRCEKYTPGNSKIGLDPFPMPIGLPLETDWWKGTKEEKLDILIRFFAPWIVLFQKGWQRVHDHPDTKTYLLPYNEFITMKRAHFKRIVTWLGGDWDEEKAWKALSVDDKRKNKVRPGRGAEYLNERQLDEIARLERTLWS